MVRRGGPGHEPTAAIALPVTALCISGLSSDFVTRLSAPQSRFPCPCESPRRSCGAAPAASVGDGVKSQAVHPSDRSSVQPGHYLLRRTRGWPFAAWRTARRYRLRFAHRWVLRFGLRKSGGGDHLCAAGCGDDRRQRRIFSITSAPAGWMTSLTRWPLSDRPLAVRRHRGRR